jgi:hypothetical protein
MKYLDSLRKKKGVKVEQKKAETPHHDELQKVQKGVFTVFAVQQGSTSEKNKAQGYGCAGCGGRVYTQAEIWATTFLPIGADWEQEHSLVMGWKCDQCGSEYQYIGGSRGPQAIN